MDSSGIVNIDEETADSNAIQSLDDVVESNNSAPAVQEVVEVADINSVVDDAPTLESVADSNYVPEEVIEVENVQSINEEVVVSNPINNVENGEIVVPPEGSTQNSSQPMNESAPLVPPVPPVGGNGTVTPVPSPIEYDEVPTYAIDYTEETKFESYFDGKMLDYLAYSFLRGFIIGITAGVFKPWADCIFYEFKFHHTIYNGKRLKFVGKPTELFVERFKWLFFTAITFGIYALWMPLKKQKWIAQNTYFADEEIIPGESFFDAKLLGLIGVNLITILLSLVSFGILLPFCICYKNRWIKKHTIITRKRIIFKGRALSLFGNMIKWVFLTLITFGIYGWWVPIRKENWFAKNTFIKLREEDY